MKAISIRAPWWYFILHGPKRLENRSRRCSYRGPILIHASKWWNTVEVIKTIAEVSRTVDIERITLDAARLMPPEQWRQSLADYMQQRGGMIVGQAEVVDCIGDGKGDPWWIGPHALVLDKVESFRTPIPCKGQVQVPFEVPDEIVLRIEG